MSPKRFTATVAVILLSAPWGMHAQVSTGTISLEVQDSSGAFIPGGTVTLTHVGSGQVRTGLTAANGAFRAPFMPVGEYSIRVEVPGFKSNTTTGLILQVDQNATITITVEPGEVRELVQVTAATPLLEANTSSIGQVVENKKIVDLPLNGRNPFALGILAGNTTPIFGLGTNLTFVGGGGRAESNEIMIDGAENNTTQNGNNIGRAGAAYTPSVDAVQEFKVQTNNFSSEFGYSAGTVMNVTMKSGSNSFHGTLFEFLRNNDLDANNFFSNKVGLPRAKFRQNQFGGAGGGPILPNRTFFFIDYEGTRQRTAATDAISDVPPASFRTGDFSAFGSAIYDPRARQIGPAGTVVSTPFPGNIIPASQINPTAAAVMGLVPLPNYGSPSAQSQNFDLQIPHRQNWDKWDTRIDHRVNSKNNLFGRFSFGNQVSPSPGRFGASNFLSGGSVQLQFSRQAVLNDTHLFTPNIVNEFRFGYTRYNGSAVAIGAAAGADFANKVGLAMFQAPVLTITGLTFPYSGGSQGAAEFSSIGGTGGSTPSFENRFQWADNLNITHGAHTFKMGADLRRFRIDALRAQGGSFIFGSTFTASSDKSGSGAPFADFLLGYPTGLSPGVNMLDWGREREIYSGTYFQDDWKISRKLTLNLGLRYDLFTQPVDARDRGSMFSVAKGYFVLPNQNGLTRAMVDGDHNNFAPRAGFAYQATQKLVVRGGYGAFYGMRDRNTQTTQFAQNPPTVEQFAAPIVTPQTVAPPFTINTPIPGLTGDYLLSSYTAANPYQSNFRTVNFQAANMPVLHQFNVNVQFAPVNNWLIETSFTGALGRDLTSGWYNRNSLPLSAALAGKNTQADRPYPNINGWVIESGSWGSSHYAAANFKVERRFAQGFTLLANYTFSKNIENLGSGILNFTQYTTTIMLDSYNPKREKTYAPLDVPQVLIMSYLYELPWGVGRPWLHSGFLSRVLGNWKVNGITSLRGGFPSDVLTNLQPPVFSNFNVPDRVSGVDMYLHKGPDGYLNPAAFRVPGTLPNVNGVPVQNYGNSARGVVRGPGSVNTDFSIFKEFAATERYRLQFRSEFFNLTNTPTFFLGAPSGSPLTCKGSAGGPCTNSDFGTLANGTATGRQIQFGLKFLF
jgi:Carboxypeptidase regulatory-like domain